MPVYEYRCSSCDNFFEKATAIADMKRIETCPKCEAFASLQVSQGYTFGDEAVWINHDLRGSLQDPKNMKNHPITTRSEYKKHLKENDIVERAQLTGLNYAVMELILTSGSVRASEKGVTK